MKDLFLVFPEEVETIVESLWKLHKNAYMWLAPHDWDFEQFKKHILDKI